MAINKFLEFGASCSDMLSDAEYVESTTRTGGVQSGIASSEFHNKMFRQTAIMCAAIGEVIKDYGLNADDSSLTSLVAAVKEVFDSTTNVNKLLINSLLTNLKLTVNSSNIDAWCDLFLDNSMIDVTNSSNFHNLNGIKAVQSWDFDIQYSTTGEIDFGNTATGFFKGITINVTGKISLSSISVELKKYGSPTDNVLCQIRSFDGTTVGSVLHERSLLGSSLTTSLAVKSFDFSDVVLDRGQYAILITRSGAYNGSNFYYAKSTTNSTDSDYVRYRISGSNASVWTVYKSGADIQYKILFTIVIANFIPGEAEILWDALASSEALSTMAISAEQNAGTGTISWALSDDGANWVTVSNLNEMVSTSFEAAAVYLRCLLTGDAAIEAVAWGGF